MPFLRSPLCRLIGRLWHVSTGRVIELIDTIGSEADNSLLQNRPIVIESEQFEAPPDELRKVCFYLFRSDPLQLLSTRSSEQSEKNDGHDSVVLVPSSSAHSG